MNFNSAINAINEKNLHMEETDDSFRFQFTQIIPLRTNTVGSCTTECICGDWFAEDERGTSAVVKPEPYDVSCVTCITLIFHMTNFKLLC